MGRTPKYLQAFSEECDPPNPSKVCLHLICWMRQGKSLEAWSAVIAGTSRSTAYRWEEEREEFRDAIRKGRDLSLAWWEDLVRSGSAGQLKATTSEEFDKDGKVKARKYRSASFQPVGAIFTMKNRFAALYKDRIDLRHTEVPDEGDLAGKTIEELAEESAKITAEIQKAKKK